MPDRARHSSFAQIFIEIPNTAVQQILKVIFRSDNRITDYFHGLTAVVTLKAYPNDPLDATVQRISLQAGAAVGDVATFAVILVLDATELDILPGMTGRAEIHREE